MFLIHLGKKANKEILKTCGAFFLVVVPSFAHLVSFGDICFHLESSPEL